MQCPKCHYIRQQSDTSPDWQCPACGVAYAKVGTIVRHQTQPPARSSNALASVVLVIVAIVAYGFYAKFTQSSSGVHLSKSNQAVAAAARSAQSGSQDVRVAPTRAAAVIMYSLSDCGYCVQKRKLLQDAGIPFVEYFIDLEPARSREWNHKVMSLGYADGTFIGTPTFDVNGTILPNNPSLEEIRRHL